MKKTIELYDIQIDLLIQAIKDAKQLILTQVHSLNEMLTDTTTPNNDYHIIEDFSADLMNEFDEYTEIETLLNETLRPTAIAYDHISPDCAFNHSCDECIFCYYDKLLGCDHCDNYELNRKEE